MSATFSNIEEGAIAEGDDVKLNFRERCVKRYITWLRRNAKVTVTAVLADPDPTANVMFVARHRDTFFLPLILANTPLLKLAVLSSGSKNGRFLSGLCVPDGEAGAAPVSFVRVRRGGNRQGKSRARLEAVYEAIDTLRDRSILISVDRPDVASFARGSILIAKRSGRPMVPIVVRPIPLGYFSLWNWDRLRIPLPWCRLKVETRAGISVSPDASPAELKTIADRLAAALEM